jgi:hypothetical protein
MGNPEADIQFDRAEPAQAAPAAAPGALKSLCCLECGARLASYFDVNHSVLCEACKDKVVAARSAPHLGGLLRAFGLGTIAAMVGSGLYAAIATITGFEIGLVSIAVGLLVGFAVRKGADGRGGWRYQALAMVLTYAAITTTYVPAIVSAVRKDRDEEAAQAKATAAPPSPLADASTQGAPAEDPLVGLIAFLVMLAMFFGLALALPFLGGLEHPIGLVLIAIALYEAWKVNRAGPLTVKGPFAVGAASAG